MAANPNTFRPSSIKKAYEEALVCLGTQTGRKIANDTHMVNNTEGEILITYRGNPVMRIQKGKVILHSCGWRTKTTKDRMNWFLPTGYCVYAKKSVWYLHTSKGEIEFQDGMVLS